MYGGDYTVAGARLGFAELTLTVMACELPLMAQEEAYIYALIPAVTYRVEKGRLEFVNWDHGETLQFSRAEP